MLMSSSSPPLSTTASKYSSSNRSPFSFRAPSRLTKSPQPSTSNTTSVLSFTESRSVSPSTSKTQGPPPAFRSPKRPTADVGTQYSPEGLPPTTNPLVTRTSHLPTSNQAPQVGKRAIIADPSSPVAAVEAQDAPVEPPLGPQVRETPRSTFAASSAESSRPVSPSVPSSARHVSKRRRQSGVVVKVLPVEYSNCEAKILAALIAGLLMDLIGHNDNIKLEDVHLLTRFHSRTPPGISVHDYMQRLTFHATLPTPVLLAMVNYIDKLCEAFPIFTINSLTVHRFLIAAATVAAKGLCDVFWTNSTYAKVGGVSKKELAILELELLTKIEWRIVPDPEQLSEYYQNLVDGNSEYVLEGSGSSVASSSASSESIGTDTMDTD